MVWLSIHVLLTHGRLKRRLATSRAKTVLDHTKPHNAVPLMTGSQPKQSPLLEPLGQWTVDATNHWPIFLTHLVDLPGAAVWRFMPRVCGTLDDDRSFPPSSPIFFHRKSLCPQIVFRTPPLSLLACASVHVKISYLRMSYR